MKRFLRLLLWPGILLLLIAASLGCNLALVLAASSADVAPPAEVER